MKSFTILDISYRGELGRLRIKVEANWIHVSIFFTALALFVCLVSR